MAFPVADHFRELLSLFGSRLRSKRLRRRVVRGKRSHRAGGPRKFKVTKRQRKNHSGGRPESNEKATKKKATFPLLCHHLVTFRYFWLLFGSTPTVTFSLLLRYFAFSGFRALWDLFPLTSGGIQSQYLKRRNGFATLFGASPVRNSQ